MLAPVPKEKSPVSARARRAADYYAQHLDAFDSRPQRVALEVGELLDLVLRGCFRRLFCSAQGREGAC
jgi:hypothetical protein